MTGGRPTACSWCGNGSPWPCEEHAPARLARAVPAQVIRLLSLTHVVYFDWLLVELVSPSGTLRALPRTTREDVDLARDLGYDDADDAEAAWHMHRDHDLCHVVAAQAEGWPHSPLLDLAVRGIDERPPGLYLREEYAAFGVQKMLVALQKRGMTVLEVVRDVLGYSQHA